jgi:aldose sugar dehydrogenase
VKRLGVIALLVLLSSCNDLSQPPISRYEPNVLGTLEVQLDSAGTSSAVFKPRDMLLNTAVSLTATAFSVTESSGIRFFNATFDVKNNTATDFKNLSVVMFNKSAENLDGTAIRELQTSSGTAITDTVVLNRIKPAHAMNTATTIEASRADFQVFSSGQVAQIQTDARALGSISDADKVLEYGFVARNGTDRGIAAGATGTMTLAFRVPKIDVATEPSRFVVTAIIFDIPTTVVTRSREETASSAAARATAITDRTNPTEVVLVGNDPQTSSCTNCRFTRQTNAKVSSSGKTLLDDPSTVGFDVQTVKTGLGVPWSLNFATDGSLYFTERGAPGIKVSVKKLDPSTGNITTITDAGNSSIRQDGEGGVLGMELDPSFSSNNQVYICYSYFLNNDSSDGNNRRNRVSRFTIAGASLTAETVLFDDMLGWSNHNGCRVANGPDGKLYFSIGDAADYSPGPVKAQDPNSLAGKIFRINYDGSIPTDNPNYSTSSGSARALWTFGHRNPQGLAFQPGTDALWSTEHGQNTRDELNLILKGKNYGWPSCVGIQGFDKALEVLQDGTIYTCAKSTNLTDTNYQSAVKEYESGFTLATSDIAFVTSPLFPEWNGNLLMNTLKANKMYRITLNGSSFASDQVIINSGYGRLRDVAISPDGLIYFSSDDGKIFRMLPK